MAYDKQYMTITFEDAYGRTKTKSVELVTTDPAQAEIDAGLIAAAYQAATDGIIRKWTVNSEKVFSGPATASNVDTGVTMSAQLFGRSEKAYLKWPMPKAAYILSGGVVDTANALVTAIEALYQNPTQIALLSDGESIVDFLSGLLDK